MKIESFNKNLDFDDNRIVTKVILDTDSSKEIRILLKEGQVMKEHKTPFPIIVHLLDGEINFGVQGSVHLLTKGDIINLAGDIPHDLTALKDSIVRLTLSKFDKVERVKKVVAGS